MTNTFEVGQEVIANTGKTYSVSFVYPVEYNKNGEACYQVRSIKNGKAFGPGIKMVASRLTAATKPVAVQVVEFFRECEKIVWEPK